MKGFTPMECVVCSSHDLRAVEIVTWKPDRPSDVAIALDHMSSEASKGYRRLWECGTCGLLRTVRLDEQAAFTKDIERQRGEVRS